MSDPSGDTQYWLDRLRRSVPGAIDGLIRHASDRLLIRASQMLRTFPIVRRWEQTDDILQDALLGLCRALKTVKPESSRHFHNLAAREIRRALLDLADNHSGVMRHAANHQTDGNGKAPDDPGGTLQSVPEKEDGPSTLEQWAEFHRQIEVLPTEEQEVFGLIWYEGLTHQEAADVLGLSLRTVKRLWQSARLRLSKALSGKLS